MNTNTFTPNIKSDAGKQLDKLATHAEEKLSDAQHFVDEKAQALREGIQEVRANGAEKLGSAAAKLDDLIKRGIDSAVDTSASLTESCRRKSEDASAYIKEQPLKSVMVAGAVGAALALLVTSLNRRHAA